MNFNGAAMMNVNRLNVIEKDMMRSMQRISSGERITRAADFVDAHGVSEKLRGQIRSMSMASRNVQDGIALINVAEGALNEVNDMLNRMRELSIQAANGTLTNADRECITIEINKIKEEINFISENTIYNGHTLLNGKGEWGDGKGGYFQIGSDNTPNIDFIRHKIDEVSTRTLNLDDLSVATMEEAQAAIDKVKDAVDFVTQVRANLGGIANRLEHSWRNTEKMIEDNTAFDSKLRDTDFGAEMIELTKNQILNQYCNAMLAQANQSPMSIFQLLSR
jgi:flagellin